MLIVKFWFTHTLPCVHKYLVSFKYFSLETYICIIEYMYIFLFLLRSRFIASDILWTHHREVGC